MYQTFHRHERRRGSYFLPFLSLIIIGLIVVLVFQIVDYFQEKRLQALENKAAVKIAAGRAEMKIMGFEQWTSAIDGSILHEGDIIRTFPGSRVILSLLNGSVIRLNSDTEVELTALKTKDSRDNAAFALKSGEIWLKRSEKDTVRADFKVTTPHLDIASLGTVFDVSKGAREKVHVLEGKVKVAINVEDQDSRMRVADTVEVALGQEISIGSQEIVDLQSRKPLSFLSLLSDGFREGDWYIWNSAQDKSGETGITIADAVQQQRDRQSQLGTSSVVVGTSAPEEESPPQQVEPVLTTPGIVSPPANERTVPSGPVTIVGTVSAKTDKVEVTAYVGGRSEPYVLQRYVSGSERWNYVVSQDYGNLVPGRNRFTVVAIDKDGRRSEPVEIVIIYDRPREPADLSAPTVTNFTDNLLETYEDGVKVEGRVGKGIVRVFVNNLPLTRYVPDSGVWVYYARTTYGNLRSGENSYEVYGVDVDGKKTAVLRFIINKRTRPAETQSQGTSSSQQTGGGEPAL